MAKMTPGPWSVGLDSDNERTQVIVSDGSHLCYVEYSPHEANARAIAALPELVEAARGFLRLAPDIKVPAPYRFIAGALMDDLRRILARIEGEAK